MRGTNEQHSAVRGRRAALARLGAAFLLLALLPVPAHAAWLKAETQHLVLYSDVNEKALRAFARKLERFHALLEVRFGLDAATAVRVAPKLNVYLLRKDDDFRRTLPNSGPQTAGIYTAGPLGIYAVAIANQYNPRATDRVLFHEYAHHFMFQRWNGAYPTWFVEGFAEYFATANVDGVTITLGKHDANRVWELRHASLLPYAQVMSSALASIPWRKRSLFYGQSWLLTHYLLRDAERTRQLKAWLVAVRAGTASDAAYLQSFGKDIATLDEDIDDYFHGQMQYSELSLNLPEPSVAVVALPTAAAEMLLPSLAFELGSGGPVALERLRAAVKRDPADRYRAVHGAFAEVLAGDPQRAVELLQPVLAQAPSAGVVASPATSQELYVAGLAYLELGVRAKSDGAKALDKDKATDENKDQAKQQQRVANSSTLPADAARHEANASAALLQARNLFIRAQKLDANDFRSMYRYWHASRLYGMPMNTNLQNVLVVAHQLAPQCHQISLDTALMLIEVQRAGEAVPVLRPIADDPHGTTYSETAKRLLQLVEASAGGAIAPADVERALLPVPEMAPEVPPARLRTAGELSSLPTANAMHPRVPFR